MRRVVVLGVGSTIRGDDAAGVEVVKHLLQAHPPNIVPIDAGTSPESFLGKVAELSPHTLIIVDAADMGLLPGETRRIRKERIVGNFLSTHTLPLTFLWEMIEGAAEDVVFIGIQPYSTVLGGEVSEPVKSAARRVAHLIKEGRWMEIEEF